MTGSPPELRSFLEAEMFYGVKKRERIAYDEVASDAAENVGTDLGEAVNTVMADYLSIPPTISVNQGAVVMIRVDADLAFY